MTVSIWEKNAKFYTNVRILIAFVRRLCYNFLKGDKLISYKYDAWGNFTTTYHNGCTVSSPANYNPFHYRGYYYDSELGMYYLQSRYYDPVIGRFINADVYVSTGQGILGNNMYAYCLNNPVNLYDEKGEAADSYAGWFGELLGELLYELITGDVHPNKQTRELEIQIMTKQFEVINKFRNSETAEALSALNDIRAGASSIKKGGAVMLMPEPTPIAESIGIIQVGYGVIKTVIGTLKAIVWVINNM